MKELMGQSCLQWDTKKLQGAYSGAAYDPNSLKVMEVVQCEPVYPSHLMLTPCLFLIAAFFAACAPANFEISQQLQRNQQPQQQTQSVAEQSLRSTRPW
jgi:hypothetical protein